jgi:8-oxo-dGDP phosphatase
VSGAWFETVDARTVHEGFSTVVVETVRTPDGGTVEREVVRHQDAVAVVPVLDDGRILLLKQYRHPVGGDVLEIPAGTMDVDGESIEEVAHRELAEEIAHDARELVHLATFHNSAGWSTERTHVLLGRGVHPVDPPEDFVPKAEEAVMEVVPFTSEDALQLAREGAFSDAKTLIGLLLAAPHLDG